MLKNELPFLLLLFFLTQLSISTLGIDTSSIIMPQQFSCLLSNNYTFAIIRAWRSQGAFDVNVHATVNNAVEAGFRVRDIGVYMFPCVGTDDRAGQQVDEMLAYLKFVGNYSSIWVDLETNPSPNCGWTTNYTYNCQFTQKLINTLSQNTQKAVGIYASAFMWSKIMGGLKNCPLFTNLPLWYAHYDGKPGFDDFVPFGGWTRPMIKQFRGTSTLCGVTGVEVNYR